MHYTNIITDDYNDHCSKGRTEKKYLCLFCSQLCNQESNKNLKNLSVHLSEKHHSSE